ncbi:MAG: hypothetical protein AAGK78_12100, partial [Planctomycetota bacterium]
VKTITVPLQVLGFVLRGGRRPERVERPSRYEVEQVAWRPCQNAGCVCENPVAARFCRRCGLKLA